MNGKVKETRFLDALEALFTGAEVEGESGFINLMRIKRGYFKSLRPKLMEKIDSRAGKDTAFREELFDKLYTFFSRYFCESGSIYYRHLPAFAKTYERVYASDEDVALTWKTHMLYYVKSDVLVRSMPVKLEGRQNPNYNRLFYFDASGIEHKRNNEKREFLFEFTKVERTPEGNVVHLAVSYSQKGRKTNLETIIKNARKASDSKIKLNEDELQDAFRVFRRQTEADFFINKDARGFLREQFDLWMYQYMFQEETIFEQKRLGQLQAIQQTAYDIIDFIAQFEDELCRAWEKPKFVRNVNYVVTLDKLSPNLLNKIADHEGASALVREWKELELVNEKFSISDLDKGQGELDLTYHGPVSSAYRYLPLDTRHFKELEQEILDVLGNLDEALDGELIHSENWQALNTLQKRYKGRVKCIYIDPPYNTDASAILYKNNYKKSSWMSLIENRVRVSRETLTEDGILCIAIDDIEYPNLQILLSRVYGNTSALGNVAVRSNPAGRSTPTGFSSSHEYALFFGKKNGAEIGRLQRTKAQYERYNEKDEIGNFEWVNFRKHGGSGAYRTARPRLFYPLYVSKDIRVPNMKWDDARKEWQIIDALSPGEIDVWPVNDKGEEKRWKWGHETVAKNLKEFCAKPNKSGQINIYMKSRMNTEGTLPITWWDKKEYSASEYGTRMIANLFGDARGFSFPKSPNLVKDCLVVSGLDAGDTVLDFFSGSGTTAQAVIDLNRVDGEARKYVLIEMGDHFHTVLLPRIKKVIYSKDWKDGRPVSRKGVSHFLKYYTLEQYEETLKNARYEDGEQLELDSIKSPFEQYVFFGDDKLAHTVQPSKNGTFDINLQDLYPDIDIAESLSNVLGKTIRRRTADTVTFSDGTTEKTNAATMTEDEKRHFITLIKPYLWWGSL